MGDLLVPYGDFVNRNHILMPAGYCEQEWFQELRKELKEKRERVEIDNIYDIDFSTALNLSNKFDIPLHPQFIFYWSQVTYHDFLAFLDWLAHSRIDKKIILPYNKTEKERFSNGKRVLELLGIEHEVVTENVLINQENSKALLVNIGLDYLTSDLEKGTDKVMKKIRSGEMMNVINQLSKLKIRDKAGTFIGARMGRPEKAKLRKLVGSPNALFPVGNEGGRLRSVNQACEVGSVKSDFPIYYCEKCQRETIYFKCEKCGLECKEMHFCPECKQKFFTEKCPKHAKGQSYMTKRIDIKGYFEDAIKKA